MLPNGRRLGAHLPLGNGMVRAADRAAAIGASAIQVFTRQPDLVAPAADAAPRAARIPGAPRRARHRADRDPRPLPRQPRGPRPDTPRAVDLRARQRAPGRRGVRGAVRERPHRVARAAPAPRPASPGSRPAWRPCSRSSGTRPRGVVLVLENGTGGGFGLGSTVRRARGHRRGDRGGGDRPGPLRRSASTPPTSGAPATRSHDRSGVDAVLGGIRRGDRPRAAPPRPPQRLPLGVRLADRPPRARRRRADRRGRARAAPDPPGPRPRHVLPRDAGHGRGLRRGQHRAGRRARLGPADPGPAARRPSDTRSRRSHSAPAESAGDGPRVAPAVTGRPSARELRCPPRDPRPRGDPAAARARPARGAWDADQGHDMLVLRALVHDGEVPLLGPPTSIGTFHHGAAYYYLLAPAAFVSDADPVAVTGELALLGHRHRRGDVVARAPHRRRRSRGSPRPCCWRSRRRGSRRPRSSGTRTRSRSRPPSRSRPRSRPGDRATRAGGCSRASGRCS